jgi:hypothetical protein
MITRPRDCSWVPAHFENISPKDFDCSSDPEDDYNCIAWAAGRTDRPWWPTIVAPYFWPDGLPREPIHEAETLENFIAAFQMQGYKVCRSGNFHYRYEKVAIYINDKHRPTHAARLLATGVWSSKLGDEEDIEHGTLECIQGKAYGKVAVFLKRKLHRQETSLLARSVSFLSQLLRKPPSKVSPIPK